MHGVLIKASEQARAERDQARRALVKYGRCLPNCGRNARLRAQRTPNCTCGFERELAVAEGRSFFT
jgi:hypothetical protein